MSGVFKTWMMRAETGKDGTTKVIASTPSVDRYGDVVAPDWKLERFAANPVVVWSHDYSSLPPIGKVIDLSMDGDALIARIKWDDSEPGSMGATVARQFREGFLSAVSVGFAPSKSTPRKELPEDHPAAGRSGQFLEGNELLELSAVVVPANPEAVAIRAKMWGLEPDPVQRHILNVTEDEDTVTITMAKEEEPAAEEEPTEEPAAEAEEAPEEEAAQGDLWGLAPAKAAPDTPETAEANTDAMEATVRATLLDLLGYDSQVQDAVDAVLAEDDGQAARDGWAELFDND